jgi:hypothetical protein
MAEGVRRPLGYAKYTPAAGVRKLSDTPAVGIPAPDNAYYALIQCEGQSIRWRDDGGNPSATDGILMVATGAGTNALPGQGMYDGDLDKFRWIEAVAGAIVHVSYYGSG